MKVKVEFDLCPEYKFGGIAIKPFYKIENNTEIISPTIITENLNLNDNKYSAVIELPTTLGTKNLNLFGRCSSSLGDSKDSNNLRVSNCDRLVKLDSDSDGIRDNAEDINCDNHFSPGDLSNLNNVDTDGDGVRDLVELSSGTDITNPGSSPRPFIFSSGSFDPDNNAVSNPVVFRSSTGSWFIKADNSNSSNQTFNFGQEADIPFTYKDSLDNSNVGVIRKSGNNLNWLFRGKGFSTTNGDLNSITFGIFGDNIILGPWEKPGITNPGVARLYNGNWYFSILLSDLTVRTLTWGGNGDIPKPQDLDGDKIFDISVFRPSTGRTYSILSETGGVQTTFFGTGTSDHTVKGDFTGDGIEEISFWEPQIGKFYSMKSNISFNSDKASQKDPLYYNEISLGEYFFDLPLSWNKIGTVNIYTVINHATGVRKYFQQNNSSTSLKTLQWGIKGDHQG